MNDALWELLDDEELALQADQWRYAAQHARGNGKWGRAVWCDRMSDSALTYLNRRIAGRVAAAAFGDQLAIPLAETVKRPPHAA